MSKHKAFVYGTLKRGEPNYDLITNKQNGEASFLGEAETAHKYPMVIASKYNIPFVLDQPGTGNFIKGEVYEIDDKMLKTLDNLEGYPDFYNRVKISVKFLHIPAETIESLVYVIQSFKPELLQLPFITEYHSNGPHGLVYAERDTHRSIPNYSPRDDVSI